MNYLPALMKLTVLLLGLLAGAPQVYAANKVCVLAFERRIHPIAKGVQKIFKDAVDTKVVIEATPKDLYACLEEDYEEILFISHALQMDETKHNVNLGYFVEKKGSEREAFIAQVMTALEAQIKHEPKRKYKKLLERYQRLSPDYPIYGQPLLILGRALEKAEGIIARKYANGSLKLKKFRSLTCFRNQISERYPFYHNLENYNVELDQAPQSKVMSLISGKPVTNFKVKWVKRSLRKVERKELSAEAESSEEFSY